MKTVHQLLRQPVKSLLLLLLVFLACAMLVICVGQYTAAGLARANLDDRYDTVALLSDEYFWKETPGGQAHSPFLPEDIQAWVDNTLATRKDLVKEESYTQVYSACIPGVAPDNFSQYENGGYLDSSNMEIIGAGYPYRCAMLEVTLTAVGTEIMEKTKSYGTPEGEMQTFRTGIAMLCAGRVEKVLGLEQGFASPVGSTIALLIRCYDEEDLAAMELEPGTRYLVYGMDYTEMDAMSREMAVLNYYPLYDELFGENLEQVDCRMTVCNEIDFPVICQEGDDFVLREDLRNKYIFADNQIQYTQVPAEEMTETYTIPTMVKLSGTPEAFLQEGEGQLWKETLEHMEINNHGFPVLAVDKLGYQVAFARGDSRITEGPTAFLWGIPFPCRPTAMTPILRLCGEKFHGAPDSPAQSFTRMRGALPPMWRSTPSWESTGRITHGRTRTMSMALPPMWFLFPRAPFPEISAWGIRGFFTPWYFITEK